MLLLSFCSFPWWLAWLLPFLLGLLLGWAIWSKYKSMIGDFEAKIKALKDKNAKLEAELEACRKARLDLEGKVSANAKVKKGGKSKVDVSSYENKISKLEGKVVSLQANLDAAKKKALAGGGLAAAGAVGLAVTAKVDTSKLDAQIADLEKALADAKAAKVSIEGDLTVEKSKSGKLELEVTELKGQLDALKVKLSSADANIAKIQGDLDECRASKASANVGMAAVGVLAGNAITPRQKAYAKISNDNLQIVEGIGPKMEEILKDNGIDTHAKLAASSPEKIREILDSFGGKYRIIDPKTWPIQAKLANEGKWDELIDLQKQLDTGKDNAVGETDSKLEKLMVRMGLLKAWKQDDLKAVEGIGPAIEKLLHEAEIKTWKALSETAVDRLKEILEAAGSRFKLAEPKTWPTQAKLAHEGKFEELQEYQDILDGGKE